jgi:alkyl hydroperoxide reductase subunit AhpF
MNNLPIKWQKVYCKNCDEPLFEIKENIQIGDEKMGPSTLIPIGEMKPHVKLNEPVTCWKCNAYLDTDNMIIR